MPSAFHLEVGREGLATLTFDSPDRRVNVFDREVLEELEGVVDELAGRDDVSVLVFISGKEAGFIAGADVNMIAQVTDPLEAEAGVRFGQRVFAAWEELPFPTVAAIRGACMGGGTELALASTYRVASDWDKTRIGLPEIKLGILPAWGGCTRLPRLIGIEAALDIILAGRAVRPKKALRTGLVDALLPDAAFLDLVRDFALERKGRKRKRTGPSLDVKTVLLEKNPLGRKVLFDQAEKRTRAKTGGHYPAPLRALEVIRIGIEEGRQAGFNAEARAAAGLATGRTAKSLIHVFQLMEGAKKASPAGAEEAREVRELAVLGAGVMGGGIGQLAAAQGMPVRMKDIRSDALASGMEHAAGVFRKQVKRRRLTDEEMHRRMALIRSSLDYSGFRRADAVIEAVVEKLPVKQEVFAEVAGHVRDDTVLATNTSALPIDQIAAKTPHPERVLGMHFFNPVDKMPLVEVVVGERSAPWAVATIFELARRLGKTPVVVKDSPGFLVNRLLTFSLGEALWLLDEGHKIEDVDRAMKDWGMPMGPIALTDEVGVEIAVEVAHTLNDAYGDRLPLPPWIDRPVEDGRLGTKTRKGFYRYKKGERTEPDPAAYELLELKPRIEEPDPARLVDRMVLRMVDEAARCLDEEVVGSPEELDLAMILGTGFPPFRGGICRYADQRGLGPILEVLEGLASEVGERYRPSDALRKVADAGGFYR
ncbi:MAG: 3-hydroxyacyl-CoA dehydrogenase NAD-binding domain-containing protein [Thermoanaerobaculia bacterium]